MGDMLRAGESLRAGQSLVSPDGKTELLYQNNGNLILRREGKPLWAVGATAIEFDKDTGAMQDDRWRGGNPGSATLQRDGNLVLFDGSGAVTWASDWAGGQTGPETDERYAGSRLILRDRGDFKILRQGDDACLYHNLWVGIAHLHKRGFAELLYVYKNEVACNAELALRSPNIKETASRWEFESNGNICVFTLVGTNLNLNYRSLTGRVKLYDERDVRWHLEFRGVYHYSEHVRTELFQYSRAEWHKPIWAFKSLTHDQYMGRWGNEHDQPYVTGDMAKTDDYAQWHIFGGLLPEGLKHAYPYPK